MLKYEEPSLADALKEAERLLSEKKKAPVRLNGGSITRLYPLWRELLEPGR